MSTRPRVGILGVGHLAACIAPRLAGVGGHRVVLSPRNAARAAGLARRHDTLAVARDNHTLVAESDIVVLATRPYQAVAAIEHLPWRPDHTLISVCAGVRLEALMFNAGAASLARAVPLAAGVAGESPTCLYPDSEPARKLLQALGAVYAVEQEEQLDVAGVTVAFYGCLHALIGEMALWQAQQGLSPALARALISQAARAAGTMVQADRETALPDLVQVLCTPGGVTELGLQTLQDVRAFEYWHRAAQAVLDRQREDPTD